MICKEWHRDLPDDKTKWPTVVLAVFIEHPSPFLVEMLEKVTGLDYPKEKISLWVHNAVSYSLSLSFLYWQFGLHLEREFTL